jgi:mRNA interferase MazF
MAENRLPIARYSIWWVELSPTRGSEQDGTRPCLVISPDEINTVLPVSIVVPLTTKERKYPTRVRLSSTVNLTGKISYAIIDQIRTVSHRRFKTLIGTINPKEIQSIKDILRLTLVD